MAYFPFFIDISGRRCIIIGGGRVALRKAEKLLSYGADITVIAPVICGEIRALGVGLREREFKYSDLDGAFTVIAATNDSALNSRIYKLCTERGILVNSVDDADNCGFIFPSLVRKENITVGISTSGTAPAFAKYLRRRIEELLGERTVDTAELIAAVRPRMKSELSCEAMRIKFADELTERCMQGDELPGEDEINKLFERIISDEDKNRHTGEPSGSRADRTGQEQDSRTVPRY